MILGWSVSIFLKPELNFPSEIACHEERQIYFKSRRFIIAVVCVAYIDWYSDNEVSRYGRYL